MEFVEYVVLIRFMGQYEEHSFKTKEEVYDFLESLPEKNGRWFTKVHVFKRIY